MSIKCVPLGAGQDVGKSCVIVSIGGRKIMFDCGMHMGYQDERRFPEFSHISKTGDFTQEIDCVIITHFHLDHIGALPYFTEVCGYEGPIYMTYPTKALAPLMLEDYRKVMVEKRGEQEQFSLLQIQQCMKKVTAVDLKQTIRLDQDFYFRAYYAGHVLGAAMFYVKSGNSTVVYTGDYNMTPDRHLGAAEIDCLKPDLLITESTYATTVRDSKEAKEAEFLKAVHSCVNNGGKVLIPIFALGRAQELCILLDEYWEHAGLKVPIYFSAGLTMQANVYYKLLISWTNQKVKDTYVTRNTFDFKHVSPFDKSQIDASGPCVLFATPGMLSGGLSLEVFKHWAPSEQNMVILPGFCMAGTVGHKLQPGKTTRVEIDKRTQIDVRCQIHHLSFSAHTDSKGIMELVRKVAPRHVVLVHGEPAKMISLKAKITSEFGIPCYDPANYDTVEVPSYYVLRVDASKELLSQSLHSDSIRGSKEGVLVDGLVVTSNSTRIRLLHCEQAEDVLGVHKHELRFESEAEIVVRKQEEHQQHKQEAQRQDNANEPSKKKYRIDLDLEKLPDEFEQHQQPQQQKFVLDINELPCIPAEEKVEVSEELVSRVIAGVHNELRRWMIDTSFDSSDSSILNCGTSIRVSCSTSQRHSVEDDGRQRITLVCIWSHEDNMLANRVLGVLTGLELDV